MTKINTCILGGWGLVLIWLVLAGTANTSLPPDEVFSHPIVFQNLVHGEALSYEAGWNGIPAARATIITERKPDEPNLYEVKASARTENPVSTLWRMRNLVITTIDAGQFRPIHMFMKQDENRKVSTRDIDFVYTEKSIKVRRQKKSDITLEEFPLGLAYDPVSAAFLFRSIDLEVGETIETDVCDGKGIYRIRTKVEAVENVKIGIGTFPGYRINLSIEKILPPVKVPDDQKKVKWVNLWISADPARIPLRLESKVFIGYVYMELTGENRGLVASHKP
jgi:hypothetical protein